MNKILSLVAFLLVASCAMGQIVGHVNKKTKEFTVLPDQKGEYTIFGYEFANNTTRKMVAFSSNVNVVRGSVCPLGAYFDTDKMKPGDKILYLGPVGPFAKMSFIAANGKKNIIYFPKSSFTIK